jgi:PII-like signaling protein
MTPGKAKRVRVYLKEGDKPSPAAVLDWLRGEQATSAIAFRATAGLGVSGRLDLDMSPDAAPHQPVIVEWIDATDRVESLLPRLKEFAGKSLITGEEIDVLSS